MSRDPFDRLAKGEVKAMLEQAGKVETQVELSNPVLYADLLFEPDPSKSRTLTEYGWFARIAAGGAAVFEFVHSTPNTEGLLQCLRRAPTLRAVRSKASTPMRQWIFSAGVPKTAIEELGFVPDDEWASTGVYRLPRGYRVTLFVISELPQIRETLLLRLLGTGRTFVDAVAEFLALPRDAPEHGVAHIHVLNCLRSIRYSGRPLTEEEQELLMNSAHYMDIDELDARIEARGETRGRAAILRKQLKLKFPHVTEAELVVLDSASSEQLESWAERVLTANSLAEVLA